MAPASPPLAPLTPREQRVADFLHRGWVADTLMAVGAASLGALGYALVQGYCGPEPFGPQPGTAAAAYCAKLSHHPYGWPASIAVALAGAIAVRWFGWRLRYRRRAALALVFTAVMANTIVMLLQPGVAEV